MWAVWYPLQRGSDSRALGRRAARHPRRARGVGMSYGAGDLAHDVRLDCHGLDKDDNDFVVGPIRKDPTRSRISCSRCAGRSGRLFYLEEPVRSSSAARSGGVAWATVGADLRPPHEQANLRYFTLAVAARVGGRRCFVAPAPCVGQPISVGSSTRPKGRSQPAGREQTPSARYMRVSRDRCHRRRPGSRGRTYRRSDGSMSHAGPPVGATSASRRYVLIVASMPGARESPGCSRNSAR
jgi:hypothetical protein